jgi:hypothetical protein
LLSDRKNEKKREKNDKRVPLRPALDRRLASQTSPCTAGVGKPIFVLFTPVFRSSRASARATMSMTGGDPVQWRCAARRHRWRSARASHTPLVAMRATHPNRDGAAEPRRPGRASTRCSALAPRLQQRAKESSLAASFAKAREILCQKIDCYCVAARES